MKLFLIVISMIISTFTLQKLPLVTKRYNKFIREGMWTLHMFFQKILKFWKGFPKPVFYFNQLPNASKVNRSAKQVAYFAMS